MPPESLREFIVGKTFIECFSNLIIVTKGVQVNQVCLKQCVFIVRTKLGTVRAKIAGTFNLKKSNGFSQICKIMSFGSDKSNSPIII